jgi:CPA2 family monovalent cation:H+ antiporter-2
MLGFVGHDFLEDLAIALTMGAIATVVCQRLRQPVVIGYLAAGLLVGPYIPLPLFADSDRMQELAEFGVILLMFALGLEFSLRKLVRLGPAAGFITAVQVGLMIWLGFLCGRALGWGELESIFVGALMSISSTTIVAKAFEEERVTGRVRELVLGVLLCEDLVAVVLLAVLTALAAGAAVSPAFMFSTVSRLVLFLAALIGVGLLLVPRAIRMVLRLDRPETTLVAAVGICFAFAMAAQEAGYSVALGAFLAGSLVAESGEAQKIERLIAPVRDLFAAVFFVAVGMLVDPRAIADHWVALIVLTFAVVAGKIAGVSFAAFMSGAGTRTSVQAGMSLAQIGEFSFIIAGVGLATGATGSFVYTLAVAVSTITTFITPFLIRSSARVGDLIDRRFPEPLGILESVYGSWMDHLHRARAGARERAAMRRPALVLVACAIGVAASFIGTEIAHQRRLEPIAEWLHLSPAAARVALDVAAYVIAAPFAAGCYAASRRLAERLARRALPAPTPAPTALAESSEQALTELLQAILLLAVAMPVLASVQPFMELQEGIALAAVTVALVGVAVWRTALRLRGRMRQAAASLGAALIGAPSVREGVLEEETVPGFGAITPVRLDAQCAAVGRALAELDLRVQTGAAIVAITRGGEQLVAPDGTVVLRAGDVLGLVGAHDAVRSAARLLRGPESS